MTLVRLWVPDPHAPGFVNEVRRQVHLLKSAPESSQALTQAGINARLSHDPVLQRFRAELAAMYGARLERAVLFGSRARGDHREDSDYDIALFLHDYTTRWDELCLLGGLTTDILVDTGALISPKPFEAGTYCNDRPLMREIVRDGVEF